MPPRARPENVLTPLSSNPYAAPEASFAPAASIPIPLAASDCWREEDILIAPLDAHLPPRCIKCNHPATMDSPRAYLWHHPGWYALIPVLVYMVVCLFVRKRAVLVLGLCDQHRRRRRRFSVMAHGACALAAIALAAGIGLGNYRLLIPAAMLLLIGTQLAVSSARLLVPVRISEHHIRLKGCGAAFLDSLPILEQEKK